MGRIVLWGAGVLLVLGLAGVFTFRTFQEPIGLALAERAIEVRMGVDLTADIPDGLHLLVCGSGSPFPEATRAGPCLGVLAGDRFFIVDSGSGASRSLALMAAPLGDAEALLLTHFHSDHIADMGELMMQRWVLGHHDSPMPVYGPTGVERVVQGFNQAYALDSSYRVAHHGEDIVRPGGAGGMAMEVALGEGPTGSAILLDEGGLRITMFRVSHDPIEPAVGYRFDYGGRSLVISGDTVYSPSVIEHGQGADLLVHEALQPALVTRIGDQAEAMGDEILAQVMEDILDYHTTPAEAAQVAAEIGASELVLVHIVPMLPSRLLYPAFLGDAADHFDGPITIGEDGMVFSLPAGSTDITRQRF